MGIMGFLVLELILIVVEILLFEIIQAMIKIRHKPYVKFKDENNAVVYIFQISRTQRGDYVEYPFCKKSGKWKFIINKDYIFGFGMLMILLFCGMLFAFCMKGMPPFINGLQLFVTLFLAVGLVFVYYPFKAYCLLKKA